MKHSSRLFIVLWILSSFLSLLYPIPFELKNSLSSPSLAHPFGFDTFGRSVFLVTLQGSGKSLFFCFSVLFLLLSTGFTLTYFYKIASNYFKTLMRSFFYFLQAFPSFIIALLIAALLGPSSTTLLLALFFGMLPSLCKLLWDRLDEIESETWMEGAHALGLHGKVLFHHYYFKPLWELVSVKVPNYVGHLLLAEATLSFLGVGAPVGSDTWGLILLQGSEYLLEAPHIALYSGIPLLLLNLSLLKILKTS